MYLSTYIEKLINYFPNNSGKRELKQIPIIPTYIFGGSTIYK